MPRHALFRVLLRAACDTRHDHSSGLRCHFPACKRRGNGSFKNREAVSYGGISIAKHKISDASLENSFDASDFILIIRSLFCRFLVFFKNSFNYCGSKRFDIQNLLALCIDIAVARGVSIVNIRNHQTAFKVIAVR